MRMHISYGIYSRELLCLLDWPIAICTRVRVASSTAVVCFRVCENKHQHGKVTELSASALTAERQRRPWEVGRRQR